MFVNDRLRAGINRTGSMGLTMFSTDDLDAIHAATMEVMQKTGIRVMDPKAREIYAGSGCFIDEEKEIVHFPPSLVEDCIRSAPSVALMAGRTPKDDFWVGGKNVGFTCFGEALILNDIMTGEKRVPTKKDLCDATRICDALEHINVIERIVGCDEVPAPVKGIHEVEATLLNSSKHSVYGCGAYYNVNICARIAAEIVGGKDKLRNRPIYTPVCCPNSPLSLNPDSSGAIIAAGENGIPMNVLSMAMAGGTSPVTLAGTLVTHNCEALSGLVLLQLVNKGNSFLMGSSTTMMDLRYTVGAVGAPELGMINAGVAKLCQYYNLPSYVAGG